MRQQMEQRRRRSLHKMKNLLRRKLLRTLLQIRRLQDENTSSAASHSAQLPSEYLLNSTIRLFHQMGQIFRDNAAPPSNPMGIRMDSKRRKKLMQKRLAMGHKHDHEQGQTLQ